MHQKTKVNTYTLRKLRVYVPQLLYNCSDSRQREVYFAFALFNYNITVAVDF